MVGKFSKKKVCITNILCIISIFAMNKLLFKLFYLEDSGDFIVDEKFIRYLDYNNILYLISLVTLIGINFYFIFMYRKQKEQREKIKE